MGTVDADIQAVVAQGFDGWLEAQFNKPRASSFWDWLNVKGFSAPVNYSRDAGLDPMIWSQLIAGEDQLRQRVGTTWMSMLVVGYDSIPWVWKQYIMASYMDILWDNAFGNYRTILEKVSLSTVMGVYLTFHGNKKANTAGSMPDENYARELMQLFSIGLHQLNPDGTTKLVNNKPVESYAQADVSGLARVFTGWIADKSQNVLGYEHWRLPMIQDASLHETGVKTFLGTTIPAGTDGVTSLKIALDTIFTHPNTAPFVSKQLIQHLVTSNPSPAYVQRVATVFANNGSGVRGDMRAVIKAILKDSEARDDAGAAASTTFGKLREPLLRFTGWARAFGATSPSGTWPIGNTSNFLGQSVGHSPSVFNFFRPGYTPPNSEVGKRQLVAPEFQITNEVSVINYINFMIVTVRNGWGDFKGNFTDYLAKAPDSQALLDEINLRVAANQVSAATVAQIKAAVDSLPTATPANLQDRVNTATVLMMASPEYLVLK